MQAFTNTISTTMVLILLGMVVLLMLTANVISDSVKENLVVTVVLQEDTPTEEAQALDYCASTYILYQIISDKLEWRVPCHVE